MVFVLSMFSNTIIIPLRKRKSFDDDNNDSQFVFMKQNSKKRFFCRLRDTNSQYCLNQLHTHPKILYLKNKTVCNVTNK